MEIHGGLSQGFSFSDAGAYRDFSQHLVQNTAFHNQVVNLKRSRDALSLKLEPEPVPEYLGTLLENGGHSPLLGSPEMNLLKLGSPELERLIMTQQNEDICTITSSKNHQYISSNTYKDTMNRNTKVISPLISVKDLQFITETNEALESILPKAHYTGNTDGLDQQSSVSYEIENFLEPLQQVPDSYVTDRTLKHNNQKRSNTPSQHDLMRSRDNHVNTSETFHAPSCSPIFRDRVDSNESEASSMLERFPNSDRIYDNNQAMIYDVNQPTMIPNRFRQPSNRSLEKDQQKSAFNMLPLPPIDLEVQEIVKRERKKLKNRVAASKCRKKKLEREAQLELRVQQLKDKNIELNALANALRQQSTELKQRIMEHINSGCHARLVHY